MRVGIEIEFTGVKREEVANLLAYCWATKAELLVLSATDGSVITRYRITDDWGWQWLIVRDRSITPSRPLRTAGDDDEFMCELVTPVLDTLNPIHLKRLEDVIFKIVTIGGVVNESCGLHIHVDWQGLQWADKLFRRMFERQNNLATDLHIPMKRKEKYCKLYSDKFIESYLAHGEWKDTEDWESFFYDRLTHGEDRMDEHNPVRYYILNMGSKHRQNTIEFRPFNSTLDMACVLHYLLMVEDFCAV